MFVVLRAPNSFGADQLVIRDLFSGLALQLIVKNVRTNVEHFQCSRDRQIYWLLYDDSPKDKRSCTPYFLYVDTILNVHKYRELSLSAKLSFSSTTRATDVAPGSIFPGYNQQWEVCSWYCRAVRRATVRHPIIEAFKNERANHIFWPCIWG